MRGSGYFKIVRWYKYGPESDMGSAQSLALALACFGAITHAVIRCTQPRATLDDGYCSFLWLIRIKALGMALLFSGVVTWEIRAGGPFPDIADQVVQPEYVGSVASDGCGTGIAVE